MALIDLIYWRQPWWLLLSLLPWLILPLWRLRQHRRLRALAEHDLLPWVEAGTAAPEQRRGRCLLALTWLLFCLALAGPRTPAWIPPALQADKIDIVAVVDLSASMRVDDGRPDRIGEARQLLLDWLAQLPTRARLGLLVFAGQAYRILPPTSDHALARHFLQRLPELQPLLLGNDLAGALHMASTLLDQQADARHLLVFSDGDIDPDSQIRAEQALSEITADSGIRLDWIGVGGDEPGSVPRSDGTPLRIAGQRVASRRDSDWLRRMAQRGHGRYLAAESLRQTALKQVIATPRPRIAAVHEGQVLWNEYFGLPLGGGILLLLFSLYAARPDRHRHTGALAMVASLLLGGCQWMQADTPETLRRLLADGDFEQARELAADRPAYLSRYAEGVACYRLADYPCASRAFAQAAWIAQDDWQRGRAVFNLGNSYYRLGDYRQAAVLFRDAQLLGVDTARTRINREYADSTAQAVQERLDDIREGERRLRWRIAAGRVPDGPSERVSDGTDLPRSKAVQRLLRRMSQAELRQLLGSGVQRAQAGGNGNTQTVRLSWVRSMHRSDPQDSAGLLNHLMALESGLPTQQDEALPVEGQRPW